MNSKLVGVSGFVLVLLGVIATACVLAFEEGIHDLEWISAEGAALASMLLCLLGGVLGWLSFRTSTGKVAAILGSLTVGFYAILMIMNASSEMAPGIAPVPTDRPADEVFLEQKSSDAGLEGPAADRSR